MKTIILTGRAEVVPQRATLRGYFRSLAKLSVEVVRRPSLLPVFIGILRRLPGTIAELRRSQRRLAA